MQSKSPSLRRYTPLEKEQALRLRRGRIDPLSASISGRQEAPGERRPAEDLMRLYAFD